MFWKLDNILQNNSWVQEITREIRKYFKSKGKGKYMVSNFVGWNKAVLRGKFRASNSCVCKKKKV